MGATTAHLPLEAVTVNIVQRHHPGVPSLGRIALTVPSMRADHFSILFSLKGFPLAL